MNTRPLTLPETAVVTGGASGIGKATAFRLAEAGVTPAILDYNETGAKDVASQIFDQYELHTFSAHVDVADEDSVVEAITHCDERFDSYGGIGRLVHAAGITDDGLALKRDKETRRHVRMPLNRWQRVIDVNLTGTFLVATETARHMRNWDIPGSIVCLSSVSRKGNRGQVNYAAAKAGVVGIAETLAIELARYGIRVNALAPGFTATPMTNILPAAVARHVEDATPLGRFATEAEMATAIVNLLEETFTTGTVREIHGGLGVGAGL